MFFRKKDGKLVDMSKHLVLHESNTFNDTRAHRMLKNRDDQLVYKNCRKFHT